MDISNPVDNGKSTTQTTQAEKMANLPLNPDNDDSVYDSAMDNTQSTYKSFDGSDNNNDEILQSTFYYSTPKKTTNQQFQKQSIAMIDVPPNSIDVIYDRENSANINNGNDLKNTIDINRRFIEMEGLKTKNLLDEVDPKSQLANKTIFKTDNPDLSIIEINENTLTDDDVAKNSIVIIESASNDSLSIEYDSKCSSERSTTFTNDLDSTKEIFSANDYNKKGNSSSDTLIYLGKQTLNKPDANIKAEKLKTLQPQQQSTNIDVKLPETKREIIIYDSLEEFERNLPPTVTILDTPFGSRVYLIGTAHFSEESQDDVSFVIRNVRPDVVMVELCQFRIPMLKLDEKTLLEEAKNISFSKIRNVIQTNGYITGLFFILLLQVSAQSTKGLGTVPGGEFRRAFEEVHCLPGCNLHLGDRPLRITLHRTLRSLTIWQTIKLIWALTSRDSISMQEIEECKQQDLLENIMQKMAGDFPAFTNVFLKERDMYLCHSLQLAALPRITTDASNLIRPVRVVGVVGIAHTKGIINMWGKVDPQQIPALLDIPPPRIVTRVCTSAFKYAVIGVTLYGVIKLCKRLF